MTIGHADYLELAAAAMDFELTPPERETLDAHLSRCATCRRQVAMLSGDARSIAALPTYPVHPVRTERMWRAIAGRPTFALTTLRLVAVAALLLLLLAAALVVGGGARKPDLHLSVVPSPSRPLSTIGPSDAPASPSKAPATGRLARGSVAEVVVTGLRVRTAPTVDNAKSAKLNPLLGIGTRVHVHDGPVYADDYEWYKIQALQLPQRGWVASADHDGAPWLDGRPTAVGSDAFNAGEAELVSSLRTDAAIACTPRRADLPLRAAVGVDCQPGSGLVYQVGVYRFADPRDAARTYLERIAEYGVDPGTGDCASGVEGDAAWLAGDGRRLSDESTQIPFGKAGPWMVARSGCFLNEQNIANVRLTCGDLYVGLLSNDADLARLYDWAWRPVNSSRRGTAPGICRG